MCRRLWRVPAENRHQRKKEELLTQINYPPFILFYYDPRPNRTTGKSPNAIKRLKATVRVGVTTGMAGTCYNRTKGTAPYFQTIAQ